MKRPDLLKRGAAARLIPVVADTRKEPRAVSSLLAVMAAVPGLADALLASFGQSVSRKTIVNTYTEVELACGDSAKENRPDGLIQVVKRNKTWHALIEAKIGSSGLEADQIERYLRLAKDNMVDAVITISNEFAPRPTHHPVVVSKKLLRRVQLFHMSWTLILTEAILLQDSAQISDPEQAFLLRELIRFLSHESVGVNGYTSMPTCWPDVVTTLKSGGSLSRRDNELEVLVGGWHQECQDLSLQLSQFLGRRVDVYLPRKCAEDSTVRISTDIDELCKSGRLSARLQVPDAASDIYLIADLRSRAVLVSMELEAPRDKQRTSSRINWLLRQLKGVDPTNVTVRMKWASRAADSDIPLSVLQEDPKYSEHSQIHLHSTLRGFEIIFSSTSGQRFRGRRTFIDEIESVCPEFYERIGQHLKAWQPIPPRPKDSSVVATEEAEKSPKSEVPSRSQGNQHSSLLEIPEFLTKKAAIEPQSVSPDPLPPHS